MKITLINFKCWDNKTFEFGDKGVTLLSGQSGAGKTSIIEAIIFVLFGSGRKITKYGKKQCIVEMNTMWKEEKITIKRQKNPNRLVIMNGEKKYEDDAAQEIRNGEITREEGVRLVKQFDGEYPERFEKEVFNYLSIDKKNFPNLVNNFKNSEMTKKHFGDLCNKFRSPHIWKFKNNSWKLRKTIY